MAVPLGGPISDYHGLIGELEILDGAVTAADLLRGAGIATYDFNHVPASQGVFARAAIRREFSPRIDLAKGFQAWRDDRAEQTSALRTLERTMRKLTREIGPLTFTPHDLSAEAWSALIRWKRAALSAIGARFAFDEPWIHELGKRLIEGEKPIGALSTLRAGDRLIAVHYGMRSARVLHWWFPTYDPALSKFSPGNALLYEAARHAAESGLAEVDLGRGAAPYKLKFANAYRPLVEGSLIRPWQPAGIARRASYGLLAGASPILPDRIRKLGYRGVSRVLGAIRLPD